MRDLLADRIAQLDNLYSVSRDIRSKSLILSQMITLAQRIDPGITEYVFKSLKITNNDIKNINTLIIRIIEQSHIVMCYYCNPDNSYTIFECSDEIGKVVILMDTIRSLLISELIERGYLRYMREIPVGLIKEEGEEKHELSIE